MTTILWFSITALVAGLSLQSAKVALMAKKKARVHEVLLNRLRRLRMYKMLKFLGADPQEYIRVVPAAELNQQIHSCTHCSMLDTCDSCLRDRQHIVDMNFCPNQQSLTLHSKTVYQARTRQYT